MKLLLASFCLLCSFHGYSQCKYEKNGIDEFEKVNVVITSYGKILHPIISGPAAFLKMSIYKDNLFLTIKVVNSSSSLCITEESELLLLTADGDVTRLPSNESLECSDYVPGHKGYTGEFSFRITLEELRTLEKAVLEKLRLRTSDGYVEFDLTKSNASKEKGMYYFRYNVKCLLQ